ncbi:MAG: tetratricopeptide repeat protein, partial [Spirochaetales bacterium]|nr:tetratricopeptide repeat protein [Spirochaetales bacterium]
AAAVIGTVAVLLVRARSPILPIAATVRPQDAIELWSTGDYEEVVRVTTEQLLEFPLDDAALALRGFSRFYLAVQMVDLNERNDLLLGAIQDLRKALLIENHELETEIRYVLGKAYFHRGLFFYDSAIEELQRARELGLEQLDLFEYLALAYRDLGRFDESIEFFQLAIALADEAIHKVSLADILIDLSRYNGADRLLAEVVEETADVTLLQDALLSQGLSYRRQGRHADALSAYERILELNESSAEAHYGMGEVYLAQNETDRARFEWREAIRLDPNHIESLQRLQDY